jgi:hypothetical protein
MLPFPMFSPTNPPIPSLTLSLSSASFAIATSVTQTLPTFSTASKHPTHSNPSNSSHFMRLHRNLWIPGGGGFSSELAILPRSLFRVTSPLTPVSATLTKFTGEGDPLFSGLPLRTLRLCVVLFSSPNLCSRLASLSLRRYFFTSLRRISTLFSLQVHETHCAPLASHHMQVVPCGGSIQNQTSNTKYGGDCA